MKKLLAFVSFLLASFLIGAGIAAAAPFIVPQGGTGAATFTGSQLLVGNGTAAVYQVATSSATCSGGASCTAFTIVGAGGTTITATLGTAIDSAEITNGTIVVADLASADFGDFTCNGSACTIDSGSVAVADLASADFGDFTCNGSLCTTDNGSIGIADLASVDFGDFTCNGSACTVDANSIALTTDTTGNYVESVAGTANQITASTCSSAEDADCVLSLPAHVIFPGNFQVTNSTTTNATTTALAITNLLTFNGVTGSTWAAFCTTITGGSGLCDGVDSTGGGAGLATSTAIADTQIIWGTSASDVGAEAAFTYDDATNILKVDNASTTALSARTLAAGGTATTSIAADGTITISTGIVFAGDTIDELVGTGLQISSGDLQTTLGVAIDSAEITNGTIVVADLASADFGEFTCNGTACTTDNGVIGVADLASVDFGDFTCNGSACTTDNGSIGVADLASVDFGDFTCNGSACSIDSGAVVAADLANADFGDFTVSAGSATIDANAVALTTDTTGNYVLSLADDGQSTVTVTNGVTEGGAATLRVIDVVCTDCLGTTEIADSYLLNNGDVGTGDYDFGGASSFEIPNGGPTVDTTGEIGVDTTDGQFKWSYNGASLGIIMPFETMAFSFASTSQGAASTTRYMAPAPGAITFVSAQCDFSNFMGVSFYDGTNRLNYFVASSTIGTITFSTNNTFTSGEAIRVDVGTSTNIAASVTGGCRVKYTYSAT